MYFRPKPHLLAGPAGVEEKVLSRLKSGGGPSPILCTLPSPPALPCLGQWLSPPPPPASVGTALVGPGCLGSSLPGLGQLTSPSHWRRGRPHQSHGGTGLSSEAFLYLNSKFAGCAGGIEMFALGHCPLCLPPAFQGPRLRCSFPSFCPPPS